MEQRYSAFKPAICELTFSAIAQSIAYCPAPSASLRYLQLSFIMDLHRSINYTIIVKYTY